MAGLVLEGGSLRTAFTLGVTDALIKAKIKFPYIIGVSAGACAGGAYISGQEKRAIECFLKYRNNPEYEGLSNFYSDNSLFGIKYVYETIPNELEPYDYSAAKEYPGELYVVVTNAETGKAEYFKAKDFDEHNDIYKATCSLPGFFPGQEINGVRYYDGGIADSIPLLKSMEDGNDYNLVVLTRPKGFEKTLDLKTKAAARYMSHFYPKITYALKKRYKVYNDELALVRAMEKTNKAIVLYPSKAYDDLERDPNKLLEAWEDGYRQTMAIIDKIEELSKK